MDNYIMIGSKVHNIESCAINSDYRLHICNKSVWNVFIEVLVVKQIIIVCIIKCKMILKEHSQISYGCPHTDFAIHKCH